MSLNIFYDLEEYNEKRCKDIMSLTQAQSLIDGDMAECGVFYGLTAYFIAKNFNGNIHLFDSWQGLPEISDKDNTFYKAGMWSTPEATPREVLFEFPNIHYYNGWIPETFNQVSDIRFSMVHLDLDLYRPTLDSLKFFWDRMSPGGLIVCDYHEGVAIGVIEAIKEFFGHSDFPSTESGQMLIYKPVD